MPRYQKSKAAVMLDVVRLQSAPVSPVEAGELFQKVRSEITGLGLTDADASWFWRKMQRDSWQFQGVKVLDWAALIRSMQANKFFPSQR